jgi:hypothetical protein
VRVSLRWCLVVACALAGVAAASPMTPADLARKNERGYVTGVPLFAYSDDYGAGGGARGYYYWNGVRDDPRFAVTPYLHRVFLNVFATTHGLQYHWLDYDAPRIAGTQYRLRGQLIYARNTAASYYGLREADRRLHFPGAPGTFDRYADYVAAEKQITGGVAYTKYDQLDGIRPVAQLALERALGHVRILGGVSLAYARIRDYTGTTVDAIDATGAATTAPNATTRFREDCDAHRLVGCGGGRDGALRLAVSYDTRDYEPDPNSGIAAELDVDIGTPALGGEYEYVRALAAVRGYWSPVPERTDLVLAGRLLGLTQTEGTPFFSMNLLPFIEDVRTGLGGHRTMRGFRQDRFVGHVEATASVELRWTFARTCVLRQKLAFIVVPFADLGRAFDHYADLSPHGWRPSYGGALRVSWNLATIGTLEYGISAEGTGTYVNFGHMF